MFWRVLSGAVLGIDATMVTVEVDLGPGLQAFHLVGLPDGAVREARVRVRAAMENAGWSWPTFQISVNLAPADLRKDGTCYDLPIAVAILAATQRWDQEAASRLERYLVAGELSLDGRLRPARGVLSLALGARDAGLQGLLLPAANAEEAALVPDVDVVGCATLQEAVSFLLSGERPSGACRARVLPAAAPTYPVDMHDIRGQEEARRALEVAAAGGHNVLFVGPPGSGKTMLARRALTILPALSFQEALEVTQVHSVAGLTREQGLILHRPFRAPHHTISEVGLVGGGSGVPRPGEISLAHRGVLFLDELPEFRKSVLEVLRQPLEDGSVVITRSQISVLYPAEVMLIASMNPCPCGHLGDTKKACVDTPQQIQGYRQRLSGPLLDRIDMHIEVPSLRYESLRADARGEASDTIRQRVESARTRQRTRLEACGLFNNAAMGAREVERFCRPDSAGHALLESVVDRLGMSARAWARILKVARTIADLEDASCIASHHIAEAIRYRSLDQRQRA